MYWHCKQILVMTECNERCFHKDKVHSRSCNGGYKMISYYEVSLFNQVCQLCYSYCDDVCYYWSPSNNHTSSHTPRTVLNISGGVTASI